MTFRQTIALTDNKLLIYVVLIPYRFTKKLIAYILYSILFKYGHKSGISVVGTNNNLIVCLTTIPERIKTVHLCIESIMRQSIKPSKILLWLSNETYGRDEDNLMEKYNRHLDQLKSRGLEIEYCEDIGPYSKTINALKKYPDSILIVADDDLFYPKNWLLDLYVSYKKHPQLIHCHQARLITFNENGNVNPYFRWRAIYDNFEGPYKLIFPITMGGCLYPPNVFHKDVFNQKVFLELCPIQDDLWLYVMALLNKVNSKKVRSFPVRFIPIIGTQKKSLWSENILKNDMQISAVFNKYNIESILKYN